ncbi:unnamed protein product [Nesidiocoris tenuis]|uniref:Uncharacterized protein n=1 Tax=Nesidiocoris tenuis TaxID=355587 RepID=A0A6H5GWK4_9HEMI|nr:unnamed protein product [Nesidiocoris tenuis]
MGVPPALDADKFKKPAEFFRSSQSQSQIQKPAHTRKPAHNFSGSSHGSLSQTFQNKKPTATGPSLNMNQISSGNVAKPGLPIKSMVNFDANLASNKALQLQWEREMRLAKKAKLEAQRSQGRVETKNSIRNDNIGKSPLNKSSWADVSKTTANRGSSVSGQKKDPWYSDSDNVWGDELLVEQVEEVLKIASTQETKKLADPLFEWMDTEFMSPKKTEATQTTKDGAQGARTALFSSPKPEGPDIMALLDDSMFSSFVEEIESQALKEPSASRGASVANAKPATTQVAFTQNPSLRGRFQPTYSFPPPPKTPTSNPSTGLQTSFRAGKMNEPESQDTLSQSQRKMQKRSHSTEWLRGQLEKVNSEYSHLKENVLLKEGESKLLREKLKSAEEEVKKHKLEKAKEIESVRETYEKMLKETKKQLEAVRIKAMFKEKEAESSLDKHHELKNVSIVTPERPVAGQSNFRKFQNSNSRPGESSAKILCEETVTIDDDDDDLLAMTQIPSTALQFSHGEIVSESPTKMPLGGKLPKKEITYSREEKITETALSIEDCETQPKFYARPPDLLFEPGFILKNVSIIKAAKKIVLGVQPKKELNHFLMPAMKYLPHMLRQTEFSEQEFENYLVRRPTLVQLWDTTYDAFGETLLNDYEKANIGDEIPPDPALEILSKNRYFTTLQPVHDCILTLADPTPWGHSKRNMNKKLVETATRMAKQLYAALCDPRILQTTYTIYDRDPKIIDELKSCPERIDDFDPLSSERWKDELYVELRRCLVFIGYLCSAHHMTARSILNPKSLDSGRTQEFYPPDADVSYALLKRKNDKNLTFKVTLEESTRKPSEMKLMRNYRDYHLKKSTLVSLMTNSFDVDLSKLRQPQRVRASPSKSPTANTSHRHQSISANEMLRIALEAFDRSEMRSEVATSPCKPEAVPSFDELKCCLQQLDIALKARDSNEFVRLIQSDLNPRKILSLKSVIYPKKVEKQPAVASQSILITIPRVYAEALKASVLEVDLTDNMAVLCAPIDRCISPLEKQMMTLTLNHMERLQTRVSNSSKPDTPEDLDLTRYVTSGSPNRAPSRKRKSSVDSVERKKATKYNLEFKTPPLDTEIYSQIQTAGIDARESQSVNAEAVVIDLSSDDDQLVKFEKRQEIEELKKKIVAEEKEFEFKQPSTSKQNLAPLKIPGRDPPQQCEEPDSELLEIERMFATQKVPESLEASTWLSDPEDDPNDPDCPAVPCSENEVEIEFIPEVVRKFHNKLKNAALLELLSEIFKEGGVLRFTHHLNGVMLGTLFMLQNIVAYQKQESVPYIVKISTITREILYTRPSPRILLEVNVLLSYAVALPGFIKMLCHNADPETCVTRPNQVYFKRGACLLEVICILVTYSVNSDSDDRICAEMSHWVHRIICSQRDHMAFLYGRDFSEPRQCKCIHALSNTIVMIYHRSLSRYRESVGICSKDAGRQTILKNIVVHGIKVLWIMYSYEPTTFLDRIQPEYLQYKELLGWLYAMHRDTAVYKSFQLPPSDFHSVSELLKNNYNPNPSVVIRQEHQGTPNLKNCSSTLPWGENLDDWSSIVNCSDSEED